MGGNKQVGVKLLCMVRAGGTAPVGQAIAGASLSKF